MKQNDKKILRQKFLEQRKAQDAKLTHNKSICAQEFIIKQNFWKNATSIALYMQHSNEVETNLLIETAWEQNKTVLLPRCNAAQAGHMDFYICKAYTELVQGKFNILEPAQNANQGIYAKHNNINLVIIPGLAFDRKGYRIGFGGGYYDRFLASNPHSLCIGLAFDWQIVDEIPTETFDKRMQAIATESGIIWI